MIGAGVLELIANRPDVTAVGGLTLGADPIVGATLALAAGSGRGQLRGFLVRKEAKTHGTGNLVEGPLEPGSVWRSSTTWRRPAVHPSRPPLPSRRSAARSHS